MAGSQSREYFNPNDKGDDGLPKLHVEVGEDIYSEIKKLNFGSSFNEHALEKIKGGSLTQGMKVICLQECHMATLSKEDYGKCLAKFETKAITKMLYFL